MSLSWVFYSFSDKVFNITSVANIMHLWGHILSGFADKEFAISISKPHNNNLKIITLQGYWEGFWILVSMKWFQSYLWLALDCIQWESLESSFYNLIIIGTLSLSGNHSNHYVNIFLHYLWYLFQIYNLIVIRQPGKIYCNNKGQSCSHII